MLEKLILWILLIATCILIFNFSSDDIDKSKEMSFKVAEKVADVTQIVEVKKEGKETNEFIKFHIFIRKVGHFLEFALLAILAYLLAKAYNIPVQKSLIIALVFSLAYAVFDEIHQLFSDGRDGRILDIFIDFCGSAVGAGVFYLIETRRIKKQTK